MTEAVVPRTTEETPTYGHVIVLSCFVIMMIAWGVNYSYGVFVTPLEAEFRWPRAVTASAFSVLVLVRGILHISAGHMCDRFGPRAVVSVFTVFLGAGYLLMSLVSEVWHLYLFYGVVVAAGLGGEYVPLLSTITRWFTRRRGMAIAIATTGISVGTIVMPPVLERLIFSYGWRNAFAITGVASFVIVMTAAQFLKSSPHAADLPHSPAAGASRSPELTLKQAMRTSQFWLVMSIFPCQYFCTQFILVHIAPFMVDRGISSIVAAGALTAIGVSSLAGRLIAGALSDRAGNKNSMILTTLVIAVSLLLVLAATEAWTIYVFAIVFGLGYGGIYTLSSPLIADLFGLRSHGLMFGVSAFAGTIGGALGPAMGGYIVDVRGSYQMAFVASLLLTIVSLVLTCLLKPTPIEEEKDGPTASA